jgi:hypothetical protein
VIEVKSYQPKKHSSGREKIFCGRTIDINDSREEKHFGENEHI